jgi:hypothetical protein
MKFIPLHLFHKDVAGLRSIEGYDDIKYLLRRPEWESYGFGAAQLTSNYIQANGIRLSSKRLAYTRGPDNRPILDMLMVFIEISNVSFT